MVQIPFTPDHAFTKEVLILKDLRLLVPFTWFETPDGLKVEGWRAQVEGETIKAPRMDEEGFEWVTFDAKDISLVYPEVEQELGFKPRLREFNIPPLRSSARRTDASLSFLSHFPSVDVAGGFLPYPSLIRDLAAGLVLYRIPSSIWGDDSSHNKSKKWNPHTNYTFTNAALPSPLQSLEGNAKFLMTSGHATPLKMGGALSNHFMYVFSLKTPFSFRSLFSDLLFLLQRRRRNSVQNLRHLRWQLDSCNPRTCLEAR